MEKKSLIDKLLAGVDSVMQEARKGPARRKIQRAYDSAIDDLDETVTDKKAEVEDLQAKLVTVALRTDSKENKDKDIANALNQIAEATIAQEKAKKMVCALSDSRKAMFGDK